MKYLKLPEITHRSQLSYRFDVIKAASLCSAGASVGCLFVSLFPQEGGETGNGRLLRDLHGRIFLYRFLLLFSGFWPSLRGYSSLHSCCWRTWLQIKAKVKGNLDVKTIEKKEYPQLYKLCIMCHNSNIIQWLRKCFFLKLSVYWFCNIVILIELSSVCSSIFKDRLHQSYLIYVMFHLYINRLNCSFTLNNSALNVTSCSVCSALPWCNLHLKTEEVTVQWNCRRYGCVSHGGVIFIIYICFVKCWWYVVVCSGSGDIGLIFLYLLLFTEKLQINRKCYWHDAKKFKW